MLRRRREENVRRTPERNIVEQTPDKPEDLGEEDVSKQSLDGDDGADSVIEQDQENVLQSEPKARKPGGRNNATKHGAFAQDLILPNENGEEFDQLHQSLIEEWSPDGATEENVIFNLAKSFWVERRVERYHNHEVALAQEQPMHRVCLQMAKLAGNFAHADDDTIANRILGLFPQTYREWIKRQFPRTNYKDARSWIAEVKSLAIPHILDIQTTAAVYERDTLSFQIKQSERIRELLDGKVKLDERLHSHRAKLIKMIVELKAAKQIMKVPQIRSIEHDAAALDPCK